MERYTTIDDLAALMMKTMASKEDIEGLATKNDMQELRTHRREFEDVLGRQKYIGKKRGIERGVEHQPCLAALSSAAMPW
jgi:hypothetical protein